MEIITILLLLLLGISLLVIEFMLIPGVTVAGIGSVIAFGAAVFFSFKYWGSLAGFLMLVAIIVFVPILLYLLFKGRAVKPMMLDSIINGKVNNIDDQMVHVGDEGFTIGRLAPSGRAKINNVSVDARSLGGFVDPKTHIKVIKIEGNTVIVEPIKE